MREKVFSIIDVFYFIFRPLMPLKTYRYAICGGSNMVLDMILYFFFYQFIFDKQDVDFYFTTVSSHIASLFVVFPITFITGFLLNKYITFTESDLRGRVQFFRYFIVGTGAIGLSYLCMKVLVDGLGFYATPSRFATMIVTVVYSYILQNSFSFKTAKQIS